MARGTLTFPEAQKILAEIVTAFTGTDEPVDPETITMEDFTNFTRMAREAIEPMDFDIRMTRDQVRGGQRVWVFMNAHSDVPTQLATTRTPEEVAYIKRLLDAMFNDYNTPRMEVMAVDEGQALKVSRPSRSRESLANENGEGAAAAADKGLKHSEVLALLSSLVAEGWLEKSREGFFSLSPRALVELWAWLVETYNDPEDDWLHIKDCEACKEIMLEYFAYKKFKKNKGEKEEKAKGKAPEEVAASTSNAATPSSPAPATPLLDDDDKNFLERLTATLSWDDDDEEEGPKPALPPRVKTPDLTWDSDSESFRREAVDTAVKEQEDTKPKKTNRLSQLLRRNKKGDTDLVPAKSTSLAVPSPEVDREKDDLTKVLDDLNLSARNNRAFSLSDESTELMKKFTVILKDLVNGVPTAVNDLTALLDDPDNTLAKNYEKLPSSLKKLVTQLPEKLSSTLAPELLAVAAEAQGLSKEDAAAAAAGGAAGGIKGAAKRLLVPKNLKEMVTKPGAIVSMLRGIMNALKVRWPAFMGTNVIWSLALFLLLFVLWYCHKRGKEERLEREKSGLAAATGVVDGSDRIEELPDDPTLPAPTPTIVEPPK
ncbi:Nse1 non-SMC component of SMC5-6 complex-domain-containing protein [Podospora aff. communis PSN243]|uniref:Nse1 non-SMC component of SMC5-6 complex-domain-containing protein n=1 Tax=Podospora aff. communis PSN243 TaxID=3040156 RepID=A0AAV9GJE8_9PEZI|nr:Nse1 non-SMC component of SMC5-6 complex-domain-containing protein [Podospora aff. communis PSN243]